MEWNVIYHDINTGGIEPFNVFNHWKFTEETEKCLKKAKSKEELSEPLRKELFYYFWSKSEYEVLVQPWAGRGDPRKIDIYWQVMLNWDIFLDYVWSHK